MKKHAGGRPRIWTQKKIEDIRQKLASYVDETKIPIIAEFAYKNDIIREELYAHEEFCTLLKKLIAKKEANLELGMLAEKLPASPAIFSLKQLGWSDKVENVTKITGMISNPEIKLEKAEKENFKKSLMEFSVDNNTIDNE